MDALPLIDTTEENARLWRERDLDSFLNEASRALSAGTATDWGMASRPASAVPVITLGGGIPDPATLPRAELLQALQRALAAPDDTPLRYAGPMGHEPLRALLAERYGRSCPFPVTPDQFMLTNGSAGAIASVCAALIDRGDVVVTEAPTFTGSVRTLRGHGAEVVAVPMDAEGLDTAALGALLARLRAEGRRVKLIYTIATHHNPAGVTLSPGRRLELLRLAAEHGAFVLDDDAYGEIAFDGPRPPLLTAVAGGHGVITAGSFSKWIATGLRVGWVHAPAPLVERLVRMRFDMGNSPLLHSMLAEFMAAGHLDAHLARVRPVYAAKAEALQRVLTEQAEPYLSFIRPAGGFFLWVRLRDGLTAEAVQQAGLDEGVAFPVGRGFFPDRRDPDGEHIRLAHSWTSIEDLREAAARLARACERAARAV